MCVLLLTRIGFLGLLTNLPFVLCRCDDLNRYIFIKTQASELVIEVQTDEFISIQSKADTKLSSSDYQQWLLEPSGNLGLFNILNKSNGKALSAASNKDANNIIAAVLTTNVDNSYQQWYINSEGSIINAKYKNFALDVKGGKVERGTQIILWDRYNDDDFNNEKFTLVY